MNGAIVYLDASKITDGASFHEEFARLMGFPDFYGGNMNAWNDCMSYIDCPDAKMSSVTIKPGQVLTLHIEGYSDLRKRCPEIVAEFLECSAFVNWRRVSRGEDPLLALSFYG